MTTIFFEEDLKIGKVKFKNIVDFVNYLKDNYYGTELKMLDESEITPGIKEKMAKTKKLPKTEFVNI